MNAARRESSPRDWIEFAFGNGHAPSFPRSSPFLRESRRRLVGSLRRRLDGGGAAARGRQSPLLSPRLARRDRPAGRDGSLLRRGLREGRRESREVEARGASLSGGRALALRLPTPHG